MVKNTNDEVKTLTIFNDIHIQYIKWEDFVGVVEFNKDGIRQSFIDVLYDIKLTNEYGEYLDKKLQGHMLIGF